MKFSRKVIAAVSLCLVVILSVVYLQRFAPARPAGTAASELLWMSRDIVGTWQSTDDPQSIKVFSADGTCGDQYRGDASATSHCTWELLATLKGEKPANEANRVAIQDNFRGSFLKTVDGSGDVFYYELLSVAGDGLQLVYLPRGNQLDYVRTKSTSGNTASPAATTSAPINPAFAGSWTWHEEGIVTYPPDEPERMGVIWVVTWELVINDKALIPSWLAIYDNGRHIDECESANSRLPNQEFSNLPAADCGLGVATGENEITLSFIDGYSSGEGTARITYDPTSDTLQWEITTSPPGEFYLPLKATLKRVH